MKREAILAFALAFVLTALAACSDQAEPSGSTTETESSAASSSPTEQTLPESSAVPPTEPTTIPEPETEATEPPTEPPTERVSTAAEDYDTALAQFDQDEIVTMNSFLLDPFQSMELLHKWVDDYRQGTPGKVAVLHDGGPYPSSLNVLESDGDGSYTITIYTEIFGGAEKEPVEIYESSVVIMRAYDYVFGADWPADVLRSAVVVRHTAQPLFTEEYDLAWNPDTDELLGSITLDEAEDRARSAIGRVYAHTYFLNNIGTNGVYVRDSMAEAAPPPDFAGHTLYYKTVKAEKFGSQVFYMVYMNIDQEALMRGEHGGSVTAVSVDGRIVYDISMVDGGWIFIDDAEQIEIVPGSEVTAPPELQAAEVDETLIIRPVQPTPDQFPGEDLFVYNGVVCVQAERRVDTSWVMRMELVEGEYLGEIKRTGVTEGFEDWDANRLPVGTSIYQHAEQPLVLIAERDGAKIPYLMMLEGY